ncbi:hypothetical protein [Nocardia lasii]|uniref:Uncharacterized protein n=1 Tax=Nocardia lasii TaxID=1616107 RepID=A0ABW1JMJ9_9NOCA
MWPTEWPAPARAIASGVDSAVTAAHAADPAGFTDATADLADLPADQLTTVLSAIIRELLETAHPDGLTGDDVRAVLAAVVRRSAAWLPTVDPGAIITALTGALGIDEAEDPDRAPSNPRPAAILLIEYLADLTDTPPDQCVRRAIAEIARGETIEMP